MLKLNSHYPSFLVGICPSNECFSLSNQGLIISVIKKTDLSFEGHVNQR